MCVLAGPATMTVLFAGYSVPAMERRQVEATQGQIDVL